MVGLQKRFQNRLDEMEEEMKDLRAGRSISPGPNRAASGMGGQPIVDDLQLVIGGWKEARKADIEEEVRRLFSRLEATPLLKDLHIPFIRSNFARIELQFGTSKLAERRQVQALTLKALKQHESDPAANRKSPLGLEKS